MPSIVLLDRLYFLASLLIIVFSFLFFISCISALINFTVSLLVIVGPQKGVWWLSSENDPRFNVSSTGYVGFGSAEKAHKQLAKTIARKFKCSIPDDLEWGFMKD